MRAFYPKLMASAAILELAQSGWHARNHPHNTIVTSMIYTQALMELNRIRFSNDVFAIEVLDFMMHNYDQYQCSSQTIAMTQNIVSVCGQALHG